MTSTRHPWGWLIRAAVIRASWLGDDTRRQKLLSMASYCHPTLRAPTYFRLKIANRMIVAKTMSIRPRRVAINCKCEGAVTQYLVPPLAASVFESCASHRLSRLQTRGKRFQRLKFNYPRKRERLNCNGSYSDFTADIFYVTFINFAQLLEILISSALLIQSVEV